MITANTGVSWDNVTLTFVHMSALHNDKLCTKTQISVLFLDLKP